MGGFDGPLGRSVHIDKEMGETVADLMREAVSRDVLDARESSRTTGPPAGGITLLTLQYVERAALLLEGHPEEEVGEEARRRWFYKYGEGWDQARKLRNARGQSEDEFVLCRAREVNEASRYRRVRRSFLREDLGELCARLGVSPEELVETFDNPGDPARQELLNAIPGSEEEIAEKIARARDTR